MTQTELGNALGGLTFQQIQKYERGINRVGATRLYEIAMLFEVPITCFFEELPAARPNGTEADVYALAAKLVSISDPTVRRKVLRLIDSITKAD